MASYSVVVILLHRITPFACAAALLAGFVIAINAPTHFAWSLVLFFVVTPLLLSRLLLFDIRRPAFWVFLGVPLFCIAAAFFFFLFLESETAKWLLAGTVVILNTLYAENLFSFYHLPSAYQAYSLEYLSLVIAILSSFFFTAAGYASNMFLKEFVPIWLSAIVVFFATLFLTLAMFWVSKVGFETGRRYAFTGAVVMTECYVVLSFLPTSFVTNAAAFSILLYCFLGLMRAHVLERLSRPVVRRYAFSGTALLLLIFLTAQWL